MNASNSTPDFSIITVCYNAADTVQRTIESVLAQKNVNLEYILIDGGSTDETLKILEPFRNNFAHIISEPDSGLYNAMNKGLKLASGRWIAFLNADDAYLSNVLVKVKSAFLNSDADIVHGNILKERKIGDEVFRKVQKPEFDLMETTMGVNHPATFSKKIVFDKIGTFNEQYQLSADYDWVLRAFYHKYRFHYIDENITFFSLEGQSNTNCRSFVETYKIHKAQGTGNASGRKLLILKCYLKTAMRKIALPILNIFGFKQYLDKHLKRKWSPLKGKQL